MSEVLVGAGLIATWGGSIWVGKVAASKNHNFIALLCALIPPFAIFYGIDNLESCWKPLLILFIGIVIFSMELF